MIATKNMSDMQSALYVLRSYPSMIGPHSSPQLQRLLALTDGNMDLVYLRGGKAYILNRRMKAHQADYGNDVELIFITPVTCTEKAEKWLHSDFKLNPVAISHDWVAVKPEAVNRMLADLSRKMSEPQAGAPPLPDVDQLLAMERSLAKARKEVLDLRQELENNNKMMSSFLGGPQRLSLFKEKHHEAFEQRTLAVSVTKKLEEASGKLKEAEKEIRFLKRKRESDPTTQDEALVAWLHESNPKYICRKTFHRWLKENNLEDRLKFSEKGPDFSKKILNQGYHKCDTSHAKYGYVYQK